MYEMKFWFEHGGGCLWSGNDETRNAFGYKVSYDTLPVSDTLKDTLTALEERYRTYLNWDNPAAPSPWTHEEKQAFLQDAERVYQMLCEELGDGYIFKSQLNTCVSV